MNYTQSVTTVVTEAASIIVRIHCNELVLSEAELAVLTAVSGVGELAARLPPAGELELVENMSHCYRMPRKITYGKGTLEVATELETMTVEPLLGPAMTSYGFTSEVSSIAFWYACP